MRVATKRYWVTKEPDGTRRFYGTRRETWDRFSFFMLSWFGPPVAFVAAFLLVWWVLS